MTIVNAGWKHGECDSIASGDDRIDVRAKSRANLDRELFVQLQRGRTAFTTRFMRRCNGRLVSVQSASGTGQLLGGRAQLLATCGQLIRRLQAVHHPRIVDLPCHCWLVSRALVEFVE